MGSLGFVFWRIHLISYSNHYLASTFFVGECHHRWEQGLIDGYHCAETAKKFGQKRINTFNEAYRDANLEMAKPIEMRMKWKWVIRHQRLRQKNEKENRHLIWSWEHFDSLFRSSIISDIRPELIALAILTATPICHRLCRPLIPKKLLRLESVKGEKFLRWNALHQIRNPSRRNPDYDAKPEAFHW